MAKVKFNDPTMTSFSGHYGVTLFKDGVSVDDVNEAEARTLGAITSVSYVETGEQVGDAAAYQRAYHAKMAAPVEAPIVTGVDGPFPAEIRPADIVHAAPETGAAAELTEIEDALDAPVESPVVEIAPESAPDAAPAPKAWTREELAALADEQGIRGLREIADPMGVKNTSIAGLIAEILAAQTTPKVSN